LIQPVVIKLSDFQGPLDLLLHLIRESKMDIKTVPLASVTAQYLEYLEQLDKLDLDLAAEFIDVAATLIEIKSRGILPKPVVAEDPEDIENKLRAQLEEYKILKEASERLKEIENVDRFYKDPVELKPEYKYVLDNLSLDILAEAFSRIMHRIKQNAAEIVQRQVKLDRFTVKDKINDIRERVKFARPGHPVMFFDLFDADFTKSEMINTFLALLELLKTGEIRASQESLFSDISILGVECDANGTTD
jgi:segregation and condensation protein A